MQGINLGLHPKLLTYLDQVSVRDTPELKELRQETSGMRKARMQVSAHEGQVLHFLVKLIGAEKALEVRNVFLRHCRA